MTDRADKLRRLADRVERRGWGESLTLMNEITVALVGPEPSPEDSPGYKHHWGKMFENISAALAIDGSVDAARRLSPEGVCWSITYDPDDDIFIVLEADKQKGCNAVAHDEAHARLALALRVRAEMEDSG